jgi:Domain of unknown function (DUF4406)
MRKVAQKRRLKVIYIAGPFRDRPAKGKPYSQWQQTQNIRRAEEAALWVWKHGGVAICPHLNTMNFQGEVPDEVWLKGDLEILRRCDAVALLRNYHSSKGAMEELQEARKKHIPMFHLDLEWNVDADIESWLNSK